MIVWNPSLAVGIENIDEEHKAIFDMFGKLYDQMKAGNGHDYYEEMIDFLNDYVTSHLEKEEAFQREINYPDYLYHKKVHDNFKLEVEKMLKAHKESGISNQELIKLNLFVKDWLIKHIHDVDMRLATYYKKVNADE